MARKKNFNWRVEIDKDGVIVSCAQAGPTEEFGFGVYYVTAFTEVEAREAARKKRARDAVAERRSKLRAEGKCPCGEYNDRSPLVYCSVCAERNQKDKKNSTKRARGEDVPPANKAAAFAARRESQLQAARAETATRVARQVSGQTRLEVLDEVRRAFIAAHTVAQFAEWLNCQIEAVGGKRVA